MFALRRGTGNVRKNHLQPGSQCGLHSKLIGTGTEKIFAQRFRMEEK